MHFFSLYVYIYVYVHRNINVRVFKSYNLLYIKLA